MAGRSQISAEGALSVESSRDFANECGMRGTLRLVVCDSSSGDTEKYDFEQPYVVVGRGSTCGLSLNHPHVGFRHAYLQVIQGRLYCFDLDTETGLRVNSVPRREGWIAAKDQLWIGPYSIQLSQAPGFQLAPTDEGGQDLLNEPLESIRIQFANAFGRSSHSPLRPVRRTVTLLGRADRCHLKLSDQTVSRVHCALVRTDNTFWVVDLLGRDGTRVNGSTTGCRPLTAEDELTVGRFRMRLCQIGGGQDSVLARSAARPADVADEPQNTISSPRREVVASVLPATVPTEAFGPPIVASGGISEAVLLSLMEQFSRMQQQLMAHTHEQMVVLAEMFAEMQQNQQAAVLEQLERIREISRELIQLRMQSIQPLPLGLPAPVRDDREPTLPFAEQQRPAAAVARDTPPAPAAAPSHIEREAPIGVVAASPDSGVNGSAKQPDSRRAAAATRQFDEQTAHAWLSQRMVELEKEHQSRWHRLMQLVGSQRSAN